MILSNGKFVGRTEGKSSQSLVCCVLKFTPSRHHVRTYDSREMGRGPVQSLAMPRCIVRKS